MVKRAVVMFAMLLLVFSAGCLSSDESSLESAAADTANSIEEKLVMIEAEMREGRSLILAADGDVVVAEGVLKEIYDTGYAYSVSYQDANGICVAVYSESDRDIVGMDFSVYGTDEAAHGGLDLVMKDYVVDEFGSGVCVLSMPLYTDDGFAGSIALCLNLDRLLGEEDAKLSDKYGYNLWVLEPSGMEIYDTDTEEVGINVLTDARYADPELRAALERICAEKSGTAHYSIVEHGNISVKDAGWTTVSFGGHEWRIGVAEIVETILVEPVDDADGTEE